MADPAYPPEAPSPSGFPLSQVESDPEEARKKTLLWDLLEQDLPNDTASVQRQIVNHCIFTLARTRFNMDNFAGYNATALAVRDRLLESWNPTQQHFTAIGCKRVYYMSLEFLLGRSLNNAILNMELEAPFEEACKGLGFILEDLYDEEKDAALGNGGLGRLAACFMDSLATLDYPAWGYGIRYRYGMFQQNIIDGYQAEFPDYWLNYGNPWEIPRLDVTYSVRFYGKVTQEHDPETDTYSFTWDGGDQVQAVAYDTPIPGYGTRNTINIRLWDSKPHKEFDLESFNQGDYRAAIDAKRRSEDISAVLYPNDNTYTGKELRLKQQYFFVCATLQDVMRRFRKTGKAWSEFPDMVAIQLNDTHPSLSVAELQRVLVDIEGLSWENAWAIVTRTFSFTNHTVLPEALEKWNVDLMESLLPRHMSIIYDINYRFLQEVERKFPGNTEMLEKLSIIGEGTPKRVRMANLAIVGSHTVNGVAALHSELLRTKIFPHFVALYGEDRIQNKTNGVTPRRWINQANPELAALISTWLEGPEWLKDLDLLVGLRAHAKNPELHRAWAAVKAEKKAQLAAYVKTHMGLDLPTDALYDVQVKRIHEYKRQLMNILSVIHRYHRIKDATRREREAMVPRVVFFGGKAAPGYYQAKKIIKLINSVADVVNADADVGDLLKVCFVPNYNVSVAEVIIPASDVSEHISTAGMEASGTSNMKFALNGGLIIGTMDGANIEIAQEIGEENMFIFGALAAEVADLRHEVRFRPKPLDARLKRVVDSILAGDFGDHPDDFNPLVDAITNGHDYYLVSVDFASYLDAHKRMDEAYLDQRGWTEMSILSTAGMGFFSSDRTIKQYAEDIWGIEPAPRA